jgi:N-acetylneuraminic acid mutarotase
VLFIFISATLFFLVSKNLFFTSTICHNPEKFGGVTVLVFAAGAGLVGGVNRQQFQTIFSIIGITAQSSKGHYHNKQNEYLEKINNEAEISAQIALTKAIAHIKAKGERILPTSFDCS